MYLKREGLESKGWNREKATPSLSNEGEGREDNKRFLKTVNAHSCLSPRLQSRKKGMAKEAFWHLYGFGFLKYHQKQADRYAKKKPQVVTGGAETGLVSFVITMLVTSWVDKCRCVVVHGRLMIPHSQFLLACLFSLLPILYCLTFLIC